MGRPLAYFITFHTRGSWLHGQRNGSVDRNHNRYGSALLPHNDQRRAHAAQRMSHPPVRLDQAQRPVVHRTIEEVCRHRRWTLHALHVRVSHVHALVTSDAPPEKVMSDLKAWCTRRLREADLFPPDRKPWADHGSTRYLWTQAALAEKIDYVLNRQGTALD